MQSVDSSTRLKLYDYKAFLLTEFPSHDDRLLLRHGCNYNYASAEVIEFRTIQRLINELLKSRVDNLQQSFSRMPNALALEIRMPIYTKKNFYRNPRLKSLRQDLSHASLLMQPVATSSSGTLRYYHCRFGDKAYK